MAQVSDYVKVASLHVAPGFHAICPSIARTSTVSTFIIVPAIGACIDGHEWTARTELILGRNRVIADVQHKVLKVLIRVCMMLDQSIEIVLSNQDGVLHHRRLQID